MNNTLFDRPVRIVSEFHQTTSWVLAERAREREREIEGERALESEEESQRGALFMAVSLGHTQGLAREHFLYWFTLHSVIL